MSGPSRLLAALVVLATGAALAGCGAVDVRCGLIGVCERPTVTPQPSIARSPGPSSSAPPMDPSARPSDVSVSGELRTVSGLPAEMRADFWLGDPLPGRDGEQDVVRVPITGAVEVANTGAAENFPITTLAYTAWARYPAGGIVCRALAHPVTSPGGDCWGWWGDSWPFRDGINYAPPLEPGGLARASLREDAFTLDVPAASTAGLAEALRTPTAVVVLGERIEVLMEIDPFENVCAAVSYGAAPTGYDAPGSPWTDPAAERIIAASSSPMGCDDLPSF